MTARQSPTILEKMETALIALLKPALDYAYYIDGFPDEPAKFDMGARDRVALVQYLGSRYGEATGASEGHQQRNASFRIHLMLNQAKGQVRGTAEIEDVRQALQGQKIQGKRIQMVRDGLSRNDGPIWEYLIDIAVDVPAIPTIHPEAGSLMQGFPKENVDV